MHTISFFLNLRDRVLLLVSIKAVEDYLLFLENMVKKNPLSKKMIDPPDEFQEECLKHQESVKTVFESFINNCECEGLDYDFFEKQRKDLTLIAERPIIANIETMYAIAKEHTFRYHPHNSRETMYYFIKARNEFLNQLELVHTKKLQDMKNQ